MEEVTRMFCVEQNRDFLSVLGDGLNADGRRRFRVEVHEVDKAGVATNKAVVLTAAQIAGLGELLCSLAD